MPIRRSEIEKLNTVSVGGYLYVRVDDVLEAIKAKEAEAKAEASAETEPARALPRQAEKPADKKAEA